jgi:hypothetical protein
MTFDAAVGTSFTLDLGTLLAVPLAFALLDGVDLGPSGASEDGEPSGVPILFGALAAYADRLRVLCDAQHLRRPATPNRLYTLLEGAIRPVLVPQFAHFHPKVWALRYRDHRETPFHRLVVSTRNLTEDRSWDLVVTLDQDPDAEQGAAQPIAEMLRRSDPTDALVDDLASSIEAVGFAAPPGASDLRLHAWAAGAGSDPIRSGTRMLVVSPFIGGGRLEVLSQQSSDLTVVSRPKTHDELAAAGAIPAGAKLRRLRDMSDEDDGLTGELHAKLVVVDEPGGRSRWWLGSLNATGSGITNNAEAVVELTFSTASAGVEALLDQQPGRLGERLEVHEPRQPDEEVEDSTAERALRYQIARADWRIVASTVDDAHYVAGLAVDWHDTPPEADVVVRFAAGALATRVVLDPADGRTGGEWPRVPIADLTSLLRVEATAPDGLRVELLVVAALEVPDEDARRTALFAAIVPDFRVMLRLILLLLMSGQDPAAAAQAARGALEGPGSDTDESSADLPLLEQLVRTFARDPDRLRVAGRMIAGLPGDDPAVVEVRELWATFEQALDGRT